MIQGALAVCLIPVIIVFLIVIVEKMLSSNITNEKEQQTSQFQDPIVQDSIAPDSYVLSRFNWELRKKLQDRMEEEWRRNGKQVRKANGDYRIDFERAVEQKKLSLERSGMTADYVLRFIQKHEGNPTRLEVDNVLRRTLDDIIRQVEEEQSNAMFTGTISPSDFFALRTGILGDIVGVYIIWNQTKNMFYVGQAKRLYFRVNQHFTGHGNGDVYADYKYGDQFRIQLITLRESGYDDLDKLERDMILRYHANVDGYNKTSGNQ